MNTHLYADSDQRYGVSFRSGRIFSPDRLARLGALVYSISQWEHKIPHLTLPISLLRSPAYFCTYPGSFPHFSFLQAHARNDATRHICVRIHREMLNAGAALFSMMNPETASVTMLNPEVAPFAMLDPAAAVYVPKPAPQGQDGWKQDKKGKKRNKSARSKKVTSAKPQIQNNIAPTAGACESLSIIYTNIERLVVAPVLNTREIFIEQVRTMVEELSMKSKLDFSGRP
ncbi:hypothetical protein EJ02DRAFT_259268 [Clathrospora elynae]|uniref:Uncharacterized protein n=1 Tax=Clathrospora elynae TaxID=706981 RepID=A0A6A5SHJ0_9PLEO|nr:hypothetical protein EJ02DRAFT_259268 [Clathrospora elynae]